VIFIANIQRLAWHFDNRVLKLFVVIDLFFLILDFHDLLLKQLLCEGLRMVVNWLFNNSIFMWILWRLSMVMHLHEKIILHKENPIFIGRGSIKLENRLITLGVVHFIYIRGSNYHLIVFKAK
jgi:hypothetical protein